MDRSVAVYDDQSSVCWQVLSDILDRLARAAIHHHHDPDDLRKNAESPSADGKSHRNCVLWTQDHSQAQVTGA